MLREGVWASDPDLAAFTRLAEKLRSRGPASPRGARFGAKLSGSRYYAELAAWSAVPRPDTIAFGKLIAELKARQAASSFVDELRAKLGVVSTLPVADRRQRIGVSDELIELALAGGRLPAPVAERLAAFLEAASGDRA